MNATPKRVRHDVLRATRLEADLDRELLRLVERRNSTISKEIKEALIGHIALHA